MKNQAKLKEMGLDKEEKYYYMRFGKGARNLPDGYLGVATVCLIPSGQYCGGNMCYVRGIAFCNPIDQFVKKKGRAIALGRAIKALESRVSSEGIPEKKPAAILLTSNMFCLSDFNPKLTEYEQRIVGSVVT